MGSRAAKKKEINRVNCIKKRRSVDQPATPGLEIKSLIFFLGLNEKFRLQNPKRAWRLARWAVIPDSSLRAVVGAMGFAK